MSLYDQIKHWQYQLVIMVLMCSSENLFLKTCFVLLQIDVIVYNLVHCTINSLYIQHGSVTLSFGHKVKTRFYISCHLPGQISFRSGLVHTNVKGDNQS